MLNVLQNGLTLESGHDEPDRNMNISEVKRNTTNPVSRFLTKTDNVIAKKIAASRNGMISVSRSIGSPMCGRLNNLGITPKMYDATTRYHEK